MNIDYFRQVVDRFEDGELSKLSLWHERSLWSVTYDTPDHPDLLHQGIANDLNEAARQAILHEQQKDEARREREEQRREH